MIGARQPPRGVSLIEALVAIGVSSVLAAVSIAALRAAMDNERRSSRSPAAAVDRARLAETLRRDAWQAMTAQWDAAAGELVFARPGGEQLVYRQDGSRLERYVAGDESPKGVWRLRAGERFACEPAIAAEGERFAMALSPDVSGAPDLVPIRVRTTIGRDAALLAPAEVEAE